MVYPVISENIPPKLKLREGGGPPHWIAIKNAKMLFQEILKNDTDIHINLVIIIWA